ncbi:MAG: 2-oxoglutarate ferredoxin oxidoreductase subunit alpha, partial [Croceimicrobium sp.]
RYINPLPNDLEELLGSFKTILIPELNDGQLVRIIRDRYLVKARVLDKIQGKPFLAEEILEAIKKIDQHGA